MYSYEAPKLHIPNTCVKLVSPAASLARDFCLETSMHGFRHVAEERRHWAERVLWVVATALAVWGTVHVSLGQLQRYRESPTVVALEKNFRSWQFSLPAITACHRNRTDPSKLEEVIRDIWNVGHEDEQFEYYKRFVQAVTDSSLVSLGQFQQYTADDDLDVDLFQLAVDVMPDHDLKTTIENKNVFIKWIPVMTEFGACYSINSLAIEDIAIVKLRQNDTALYPLTCKYGGTSSCHIMMEDSNYYDFYYHSPFDITDITTASVAGLPGYVRVVELSVVETASGRGVRELPPLRRACLFNDEPTGGKVYSTNGCRQSCRSELALRLCKCVPFYYFYEAGPQCTPSGMACLAQYALNLTNIGGHQCSCSTQCLYSVFREVVYNEQFWDKGPWSTQGSVKYIVQPPKIRYTREIVFHFQDLVVSFGGAAGLFLGASFISFVEVVYFILQKILGAISVKDDQPHPNDENVRKITFEEQRIKELTSILNHGYSEQQYSDNATYL